MLENLLVIFHLRIQMKCVSWGHAYFGQHLPKPDNSVAIRLLKVTAAASN